jgi:hypothetical protein
MKKNAKANKIRTTKSRANQQGVGLRLYEVPSPFEGLSEEEIVTRLKQVGAEHEAIFATSLQALQEALLITDPILLLSILSYYNLTEQVGEDGSASRSAPLMQHHVEVVQALILQHARPDYGQRPPRPDDLQAISSLATQCAEAFSVKRLSALDLSLTREERNRLRVREDFMLSTQVLRNWGHPEQVLAITKRLFAPLDEAYERTIGLRATFLVDMCDRIVRIAEDRLNDHLDRLRPMILAKTVAKANSAYAASFGIGDAQAAKFLEFAAENNVDLKRAKELLFMHSDLFLPDCYDFTLEEMATASPGEVEIERVREVLDQWSVQFGDLASQPAGHFFLGNPIWARPLIKLETARYFWPIPGLFISFCIEMLEALIPPNSQLLEKYNERRGAFLEDEVESLMKRAFPRAQVYRGSQWVDPQTNTVYENDLAVLLDSYALIVEAKSGKVTEPARRGAPLRIQTTIDELVVKPSEQANRFASFLRQSLGVHRFPTNRDLTNQVDTTGVQEILRLNVTLDIIGGHTAAYWPDLRRSGFVAASVDVAPTLALAQLETLFEILDTQLEKLHYLKRRAEFEAQANYIADEADLLAFYLETAFNVGEAELDGTSFMLYGASTGLDDYLLATTRGVVVEKPRLRLTKWWADMLRKIEESPVQGWTERGTVLLNVSHGDQQAFEKRFRRTRRTVRSQWQLPGHENLVFMPSGIGTKRDVVAAFAYLNLSLEERNKQLKNAANLALAEEQATRAVVIGVDTGRDDYPYSVIVLARHT